MGLVDFRLSDVGSLFTSAREAITGKKILDPTEIAKIDAQLAQLQNAIDTGQLKINEVEASNPHIFVAGWRPYVGWVGGMALAYNFILYPIFLWLNQLFWKVPPPPMLDTGVLFSLVSAMLGIGTMRSFDKNKGIDTKGVSTK